MEGFSPRHLLLRHSQLKMQKRKNIWKEKQTDDMKRNETDFKRDKMQIENHLKWDGSRRVHSFYLKASKTILINFRFNFTFVHFLTNLTSSLSFSTTSFSLPFSVYPHILFLSLFNYISYCQQSLLKVLLDNLLPG